MYQEIVPGVRRGLTRVFPYGVFHVLEEDAAAVIAIVSDLRDPTSWKSRSGTQVVQATDGFVCHGPCKRKARASRQAPLSQALGFDRCPNCQLIQKAIRRTKRG